MLQHKRSLMILCCNTRDLSCRNARDLLCRNTRDILYLVLQHKRPLVLQHTSSLSLQHKRSLVSQHPPAPHFAAEPPVGGVTAPPPAGGRGLRRRAENNFSQPPDLSPIVPKVEISCSGEPLTSIQSSGQRMTGSA